MWKNKIKKVKISKKVRLTPVKSQLKHNGLELDSNGELLFCYWMDELVKKDYIRSYSRGKSYLLSDALYNNYVEQLKTKSKPKTEIVMQGHSYTNDFDIVWENKALGIFVNIFGYKWYKFFIGKVYADGVRSFIECKPEFDFHNMTRTSINSIKYLYDKHKIFCQITKNEDLFKETFVPKLALKTKTGKKKIWKFKIKTLEEYEKSIK